MYSQEKQRRADERKGTRFDWQEAKSHSMAVDVTTLFFSLLPIYQYRSSI
jgi:hypothetical protein